MQQINNKLLQSLENEFESVTKIRNLALNLDENLLSFMLENKALKDEFKSRFFTQIGQILVFKKDDFLRFLDLRILNSSFTQFKLGTKISLADIYHNRIIQNTQVVLNFAFKDCVLKGNKDKDDKAKEKEIFFNEILAKDEIDILFSPKVLCNFELVESNKNQDVILSEAKNLKNIDSINKDIDVSLNAQHDDTTRHTNSPRHTERSEVSKNKDVSLNAQHDVGSVDVSATPQHDESVLAQHDENKTSQHDETTKKIIQALQEDSNLLIKGNNLLALHSLKRRFANKVKLIYIDPPYNTGNDSFTYNDNFNHSSWLVFMKNRLEIAREFLREDGVIFIQCDDNEQAYLKVLCDEIFGRENFVSCFVWQKKSSGGQHANLFLDFHEYILCYAKHKNTISSFTIKRNEKQLNSFKLEDEFLQERGKHLLSPLKSWLEYRPSLIYDIECPDGSTINTQWVCSEQTFQNLKKDSRIVFKQNKQGEWSVYKKQYSNENDGFVKVSSIWLEAGNNAQATREIKALFANTTGGGGNLPLIRHCRAKHKQYTPLRHCE